jgi:hypothetical protein
MLTIEAASPAIVYLNPPEKLVLEIRSSGGYSRAHWSKVGNPGVPLSNMSFVHFREIYYVESTTLADLGRYSVYLEPLPGQKQSSEVYFDVILRGIL